jgi:hypothetical protein
MTHFTPLFSVLADDASDGAQIGPTDHLSLVEQIAVCAAGYTAENTFGHPAHRLAAASDNNRIRKLLEANTIQEGAEAEALRTEGADRARVSLQAHKPKVVQLAERLVQNGRVDAAEFLLLMEDRSLAHAARASAGPSMGDRRSDAVVPAAWRCSPRCAGPPSSVSRWVAERAMSGMGA